MRKITKKIMVGDVPVGGLSPITIQSMTNTKTADVEATVRQIQLMEEQGCDITRSAITSEEDAEAIFDIRNRTHIPLVADVQFDYKLALAAVKYGCDCLRINPGNIGERYKVQEIVNACSASGIPIRIGVNSGSVHRSMIEKYHGVNVDSMVYSMMEEVEVLESMGFYNLKLSIKSSDVPTNIACYTKLSALCDYPLHLGVTESGPSIKGTIKSSVGIGALLSNGIGDTIRVSITGDPIQEIMIGKEILKSLGLKQEGIDIISCPTCGRTKLDLIHLVEHAEKKLDKLNKNIKVAIMGCPVNGPGEAKLADIGIAGGKGTGVIFKQGKVVRQVKEEMLLDALMEEIEKL